MPVRGGGVARSYVLENYKEYNIVAGNLACFFKSEEEIRDHWPGCKGVYFFPDMYEEARVVEAISEEFYSVTRDRFTAVREALYDEFSKESMDAFLNEKMSGDYKEILPYVVMPQYYFNDAPWLYNDDDVLFDCGAYDGDSICDFIRAVDGYSKIIACEPDPDNYVALSDNIVRNKWERIDLHRTGLSDEKKILKFSLSGDMYSKINENGDHLVEIDTIDNLLKSEKVSIIKMDIEGAEMEALTGAEETIRKYRPLLMISVYHKKDDIFNVFQFIDSKVKNYSYFFRCHKPYPIDAVLYAIPNERLK